jgi:hypothetical protein
MPKNKFVYEVKLSTGAVRNFGTVRGMRSAARQLAVVFPTGVSYRLRGNATWWPL